MTTDSEMPEYPETLVELMKENERKMESLARQRVGINTMMLRLNALVVFVTKGDREQIAEFEQLYQEELSQLLDMAESEARRASLVQGIQTSAPTGQFLTEPTP